MEHDGPSFPTPSRPPRAWTFLLGGLLLVTAAVGITGCAKRETASAQDREVRLTSGDALRLSPVHSPDGREIVYGVRSRTERAFTFHLLSVETGEDRRLPFSVGLGMYRDVLFGWDPRGQGLYVFDQPDMALRHVSREGDVLREIPSEELAFPVSVARDGERMLYRTYTGDNFDAALRDIETGPLQVLVPTAGWEHDGCFGPDSGEVTVVSEEVYQSGNLKLVVWSPGSGSYMPLPIPEARNLHPCWSPDGARLAYASNTSGNFDIWVFERDSGQVIRVTDGPADDLHPDWSPDGRWLAFSRRTESSHIHVGDPRTFETRPLTTGRNRDRDPWVSPDGKWVMFTRYPGATEPGSSPAQLCVASTDGGDVRTLDFGHLVPQLGYAPRVCWSPDGSEIAFSADDGSGNIDIYRIPREGGQTSRVTLRTGVDIYPSWSPDGRTIAYVRRAGGENQIWAIPATGGLPRRLSHHGGLSQFPIWAPDSDHLAYSSILEGERISSEIWLTSMSHPEDARLFLGGEEDYFPGEWSEDGSELIVVNEETLDIWAYPLAGSDAVRLGKVGEPGEDAEHFLDLNEEGMRYLSHFFPGGIHAFAEVEEDADILRIRYDSEALRAGMELGP